MDDPNVTINITINVPITLRIDISFGQPVLTVNVPVAEPVQPTLGQLQDQWGRRNQ